MNFNHTLQFVGIGEIQISNERSDDYWNRQVPFAMFILFFCSFSIFLQILVLRVIIMDGEMKRLPAFQIMLLISVFDTIQLLIHLTAVYYILCSREQFELPDFIIGAVMNASWVAMLLLSILLNFNRISSIVFPFSMTSLFSSSMMFFYFGTISIIWLIIFIINTTGLSRIVYLLPAYTWHYLAAPSLSMIWREISAHVSLVDVVVSLFSHALIFSYIRCKSTFLSKKELTLTIQVLCISAFHVFGYITWEYLPIPWQLPIGVFLGHFVWMLWNSINPILYIFINPRIRRGVIVQLTQPYNTSNKMLTIRSFH